MPADHPAHEVLMGQMVEAPLLSVPLAGGIDQGQIPGMPGGDKTFFQRDGNPFRKPDPHKPFGCDGIRVLDDLHRLPHADDFAFFHARL